MVIETPTLRLHVEEADPRENLRRQVVDRVPELDHFLESFTDATGWELDFLPASSGDGFPLRTLDSKQPVSPLQLQIVDMSEKVADGVQCARRDKCDGVIHSMNSILQGLFRTQNAMQQMSAKLAASSTSVTRPKNQRLESSEEDEALLHRLESIIKLGNQALGMNAAGIFLLDDATRELHLRVEIGMGADSLLASPRLLRDSVADIEALVGNVVAIKDARQLKHWNLPCQFPSAICVPVSRDSTPMGTFWTFSNEAREFSASDTSIAEMIGGRISAELEKESVIRSSATSLRFHRDLDRAKIWQQLQVPAMIPEVPGWKMYGREVLSDSVGGALFDTSLSPSGMIQGSIGDVQGATLESGLAASSLRAALRAHESYNPSPGKLLFQVNNTMWNCPLGDQIGSLFHVQIDPLTGIASWANSGETSAFIFGSGAEPYIAEPGSPLGACENEAFDTLQRVLLPNSVLVAFNEGLRRLFKYSHRKWEDLEIMELLESQNINTASAFRDLINEMVERYDSYRKMPDLGFLAIERTAESEFSTFDFTHNAELSIE